MPLTRVLPIVGLDVGAICTSSLLSFSSGWTFAIWLLVFIFIIVFSIELRLLGGRFSIPHHRQYLFVGCYIMTTSIILLIGLTVSVIGLIFKVQNRRLNYVVRLMHLIFLSLTVICFLLFTQSFSFRGFYTDRIIISIWLGTGIALYRLYRKGSISLLSRIYYGLLFWTPIFFLIAWFIPRLHFMAAVFGLGLVIDGQANRFPINNKFQLQEAFQGMLASSYPSLDLVENFGVFEKITRAFIYRPSSEIEKINFTTLSNDSLKIHITTKDASSAYSDTTIQLPK